MSVDLATLVESLKREVTPPGEEETTFPDATDETWMGYLADGFWEIRLDGMLSGFTESAGLISPSSGTTELTRDLLQLVVFYAGIRILRNQILSFNTVFRAKAGPVEFETQKSAQTLKALLDDMRERRNLVLYRLSDLGVVPSYYIDGLNERELSLGYGDTYWPSGTNDSSAGWWGY